MLILSTSACENWSTLAAILFIKNLVKIASYIVPAILILMISIDLSKAVIAGDDDAIKRSQNIAIKRIIAGLIIFFIPLVVEVSFNMIGDTDKEWISCYNDATSSKVENLKAEQDKKDAIKRAEQNKTLEQIKADTIANQEKNKQKRDSYRTSTKQTSGNNNDSSSTICTNCSGSEKIAKTAELLAWPSGTKESKYKYAYNNKNFSKWSELTKAKPTQAFMDAMDRVYPKHFKWSTNYKAIKTGQSCDTFVGVVVKASGYDSIGRNHDSQHEIFTSHTSKWKKVAKKNLRRGDICRDSSHVKIYLGNGKIAEAGYGKIFGHIKKGNCNKSIRIWRALK